MREHHGHEEDPRARSPNAATKPKTPRKKAATVPKLEDVATAKGEQEFVKVARTKNKKKSRTWVIVDKMMTGLDVDLSRSRKGRMGRTP